VKQFHRSIRMASLIAVLVSLPTAFVLAAETTHQHEHGATTAKLHLKDGKKWQTDDVLRQSMTNIKDAFAPHLAAVHQNKLDAKSYDELAAKVNSEVANIVKNCHLEKDADEMLHLVIADMLAGADAMSGKDRKATRQAGAVQVVQALDSYGEYFDHPGWRNLKK
jgi:hypothetical protein